ncbi:hypothetical protein [Leptolyngbya sp. NIES-2104]|uniref:hypothetical protein n=1 Tax=Leptolyngbya sp. NIES-2104 TaxID=1552121 RepID=UPI0006EC67A7|nr:hypothetical protein [Leptolyngbya sp. NIES-2104]GAQ00194.1 hypothetical protein NIES2104_67590 [Leptolyngbya sp. NIES-2104]
MGKTFLRCPTNLHKFPQIPAKVLNLNFGQIEDFLIHKAKSIKRVVYDFYDYSGDRSWLQSEEVDLPDRRRNRHLLFVEPDSAVVTRELINHSEWRWHDDCEL